MNKLDVIYNQEVLGKEFKIYGTQENPLFLAKDVAEWLEMDVSNASRMIKNIDEDECVIARHNMTSATFLTEDGLYEVLMQSRKPIAKQFKKQVKNILKQIRTTGGYVPVTEEDDDVTIMARGLLIAQKTIEKKDALLKAQQIELDDKNRFINQIAESQNSMLVREVAKAISKSNSEVLIGERRLYQKMRDWGWVCVNSTEPRQYAVDRGYLEVVEGTKTHSKGTISFRTTRVTGKGHNKILEKLLEESAINQQSPTIFQ